MTGYESAHRGTLTQKFQKGDLVRIASDLGPTMSKFIADVDAFVVGSYADKYGERSAEHSDLYAVFIPGRGQFHWYLERHLELIEQGRLDLLEQKQAEFLALLASHRKIAQSRIGPGTQLT